MKKILNNSLNFWQSINFFFKFVFLAVNSLMIDSVQAQVVKKDYRSHIPQATKNSNPQSFSKELVTESSKKISILVLQNSNKFRVKKFVFKGNTVFNKQQLEAVVAPYLGREISFAQLLQARSAITKLYVDQGYITSGAFIPVAENQKIQAEGGVFTIQIVEGKLEEINVSGSSRLKKYVQMRLYKAASPVLNREHLLKALQLLQLDPLIERISARLSQGSQVGKSFLNVQIKAHQPIKIEAFTDNFSSPSVGSIQKGLRLTNTNLLGLGDIFSFDYRNNDGKYAYFGIYSVPLNTKNGTIKFSYANVSSNIVEPPFDEIDIIGDSRTYELSFRQPMVQEVNKNSTSEFALGITASRQESETSLLDTPYPLSRGADDSGRTRISAIRFFQEWTTKNNREVFYGRSQFSFGVNAFDATINLNSPDSRFFAWRGQGIWRSRIGRRSHTFLLLRTDLQISDRPLVAFEQFGLGGATTIRGYRQETFLTDNGFLFSAELRTPIFIGESSKLYFIPFVDVGTGWNNGELEEIANTSQQQEGTLASFGLGIQYQLGKYFNARVDWGIPLISVENSNSNSNSWQEKGLSFSVRYQLF